MSALMYPDDLMAILLVLMMLIPIMALDVLKPRYKHEDTPTNRANQNASNTTQEILFREYGLTENEN